MPCDPNAHTRPDYERDCAPSHSVTSNCGLFEGENGSRLDFVFASFKLPVAESDWCEVYSPCCGYTVSDSRSVPPMRN